MNIEKILPGVIRIQDFLSYDLFINFQNYLFGLKYDIKYLKDVFNYEIIVYGNEQNNIINLEINNIIGNKLILLSNIFNKIYGVDTNLNSFGSFIRLKKDSFISKHSDKHSDIQCVYHFNDYIKGKGGELNVYKDGKNYTIIPKLNSLICFSGDLVHSVNKYHSLDNRYSWSLGYSLYNNEKINYEKFCSSLKGTLYK